MSCKKSTGNKSSAVANCAVCGKKKSRFIKSQKVR